MKRSRSLSARWVPRAREPKMKRPVAPFLRRTASYFLRNWIKPARSMVLHTATTETRARDRGQDRRRHCTDARVIAELQDERVYATPPPRRTAHRAQGCPCGVGGAAARIRR